MHSHTHGCCGHGRTEAIEDERFADDEFTQAAQDERRVRTAHAHGKSFLGALLGGFIFLGIFRMLFGRRG